MEREGPARLRSEDHVDIPPLRDDGTQRAAVTLFLRQPRAPLDNNVCERALKKVILHRKNALFYKNQNGAQVGDLFMSLIHTCELSDTNPFDYLDPITAARRGSGRKSPRLDAMELSRYAGAVGYRRVIGNPQPGAAHAIG